MKVRRIREKDIPAFIEAYKDPAARARIRRCFADEETRSSWCFVAEENDARRAALFYFRIDRESSELFASDLDLSGEGDCLSAGRILLKESAKTLAAEGVTRLEMRVKDNHPQVDAVISALRHAGYVLAQGKTRLVLEMPRVSPHEKKAPVRLEFRPRAHTGDEAFLDAIKRVTEDTLDRDDLLERRRLGADEAARRYFDILRSIDDEPRRWFLAYAEDGRLAGLVVCQLLSAQEGCINYIGVVPECRGRGYSLDLIEKAAETFGSIPGITEIIADIDSENFPLSRNLAACGYEVSDSFRVFTLLI